MRSYYDHLEQIKERQSLNRSKPSFRASAIFPAIHEKGIHTRLLFLSYWLLKLNIREVSCLTTLRSHGGAILHRKIETIDQPRAYCLELADFLESIGWGLEKDFLGSLEIEFFSASPLVFPYPAVTLNYYGPQYSTVVHTTQRVFNDYEDMAANTQQHVPESGFNILADGNTEPFAALINGPVEIRETPINFQFINRDNELMESELFLPALAAYETYLIYPGRGLDLKGFLKGHPGTLKLSFDLPWIFPRLIVGNRQQGFVHKSEHSEELNAADESLAAGAKSGLLYQQVREEESEHLSITHSYYDCSAAEKNSDYWMIPDKGWHSASLSVPVQIQGGAFTKIYFYPIYTPGNFSFDLQIYDRKGRFVGGQQDILSVEESCGQYLSIPIKELLKGVSKERDLSARIIAKARQSQAIPARIEISLDIGYPTGLPCNICTNLIPFNPEWTSKERAFHWMPLLADQPHSSAWILNNSPKVDNNEEAQAILSFYRESDTEKIEREAVIPPNGFLVIRPEEDPELAQFFNKTVGWMTVSITNPYATTYYFSENPSGTIGGDHGY